MLDLYFASLERVIYFPIFVLLAVFFMRNYLRTKKAHSLLVSSKHGGLIFPGFSLRKRRMKLFMILCSLGLIFLAMLRPQWGKRDQVVNQEGRDLLIVLDVSRSMLAKDLKPNRLAFAKLKIRNLVEKLSFERIGLILFSGSAFVSCPLTSDYGAFLMFLNNVDVESISSGTTALDHALGEAIKAYSTQKDRKNKLVLLITDGEDFSSNLATAKRQSSQLGLKVFALGLGTTSGAPIPIIDSQGETVGHEVDENGKPALSVLNEPLLQKICEELGGVYFKASYDDSDINQMVAMIDKFEKEKFEERKFSRYEDRYPWFLGIAWVLLLLEWVL